MEREGQGQVGREDTQVGVPALSYLPCEMGSGGKN